MGFEGGPHVAFCHFLDQRELIDASSYCIREPRVMSVSSAQCSGMMSTRRILTRAAKLLNRSYGLCAPTVSCGNVCRSQLPRTQALPMTQSRSKAPLSLTRTWASAADSVALDEQTGVSE